MDIRWHHIKYAAANSVWVLVVTAVLIFTLAILTNVDPFGVVLVMSTAVAVFVSLFLYFLWRTQRRLPMIDGKRKSPTR
jgi:hypothetical protein